MGLDIIEATSGMGMHLKDIPPNILERQMKVYQTPVFIHLKRCHLTKSYLGILAHNSLLQRRCPLRESIHSHAILARLPDTAHAHCLLGDDHDSRHIRNLVCGQRLPDLCTCGQILESYSSGLLFE